MPAADQKRVEFVLDNGNKFFIRRYDAFLSLRILGEVQKRFLSPFAAIMDARSGNSNGIDGESVAIDRLSKSLDGDSLVDLAKKVLNPDFVSVMIDDDPPERIDEGLLNRATDSVYDVVAVIYKVLEVNYKELFTRGKTLIGEATSPTAQL
jgi:hypothetical protein